MKRFAIGDIHGRCNALLEVFKQSKFNYKNDMLIVLGDVVDGGKQTKQVVDELLKIKNLTFVLGNHDKWLMDFIRTRKREQIWYIQGGKATLNSYRVNGKITIPLEHIEFFNRHKLYHIMDNMLFVHGGYDIKKGVENTSEFDLLWDRSLISYAKDNIIQPYDKVFVGHTTTQLYGNLPEVKDLYRPIHFNNLIMMDCGAGWNGRLSIMNTNTQQHFESEVQKPVR